MKLYLVQHGSACSREEDPERPLTDHGRGDVHRLAQFLAGKDLAIERVMHSGKLRAAQTAEILASTLAPKVEIEVSGLLNPNDNPEAFDWQSDSWNRNTLLVGHLPFMGRLVSHLLISDKTKSLVAFQPGSMACLAHDDENGWCLNWMIRPELLADQ